MLKREGALLLKGFAINRSFLFSKIDFVVLTEGNLEGLAFNRSFGFFKNWFCCFDRRKSGRFRPQSELLVLMDTAHTHARTKRNDFPVRAFPPTSDLRVGAVDLHGACMLQGSEPAARVAACMLQGPGFTCRPKCSGSNLHAASRTKGLTGGPSNQSINQSIN